MPALQIRRDGRSKVPLNKPGGFQGAVAGSGLRTAGVGCTSVTVCSGVPTSWFGCLSGLFFFAVCLRFTLIFFAFILFTLVFFALVFFAFRFLAMRLPCICSSRSQST